MRHLLAIALLCILAVLRPDHVEPQTRVPDLFRKADVAVKDLRTVVAMKDAQPQAVPDGVMPAVYLNLGLAFKKTGQPGAARAAWEKAKALYPAAPEAAAMDKELRGL